MDSALNQLIEQLTSSNLLLYISMLTALVGVSSVVLSNYLRRRNLFYSEDRLSVEESERIHLLEKEVIKLRKDLSKDILKNSSELIESEIRQYLSENMTTLTQEELSKSKTLENSLFIELENRVNSRIDEYLNTKDSEYFSAARKVVEQQERRYKVESELYGAVELERKSAGLLKSVMINLFIIVNFALILLYLLKGADINQYGAISISGLYISLAGFIIYIFRSSNSRTSVLLAIKEDLKKQNTALEYIESVRVKGDISENDIDFIRMIMANHAEREKTVNHPYEMILKGVSGTNIQFKGGKMSLGETGNKK
ncbi:hypothetical protein [Vibrio splendidus]|uniref:hypothetical protein n=1 Tax=Vibrio splendidus TaxID=29497 RepID=UPI002468EF91|nr:hypothetical protein [Vibrio splendidus]MDH5919021.1 hypothetical protein [Vibrio splendidus]